MNNNIRSLILGSLFVSLIPLWAAPIVTQPQSQYAVVGTNVTFAVGVAGVALPAVSSGTLELWLKADAGVITNAAGLVSQWQDQSGNGNNALQTNITNQPVLGAAAALGGEPVVQFNGIQDGVHGSYLHGTGDVGLANAMTSFTMYDASNTSQSVNVLWLVGVPGLVYGASRCDVIYNGEMTFSAWSYAYSAPFNVPTNTFRIWNDRLTTNLNTLQMYDFTPNSTTNFTGQVSGPMSAPGAGYYVGGLNPALQYVTPFNFNGDIAEIIIYQGYLTDADRMAVVNYLEQKYYQGYGLGSVSYQWQFDGTNIAGATGATLTLNDVQLTNSGNYTVIVSNMAGTTTSSNAVLTVGYLPSITIQPSSQEVVQATDVSFAVGAAGAGPLSYQWYQNGVTLAQETNSTISLTNVQATNSGTYDVVVSDPFGSVASSNATLIVDLLPFITAQPQSQAVLVGTNVAFSVTADGNGLVTLPAVSSGTLELWLKADTGVITNVAGQVSQWQDQSGNANHAGQPNITNQPLLVTSAALGGKPVVQFNGVQDGVHGSYLYGTGSVGFSNALTTFTVYNALNTSQSVNVLWLVGVPGTVYGASRCDAIVNGEMQFSAWSYYYSTPFVVPTNTYRIWNDRLSTNLATLQMYDSTETSSTNFVGSISGMSAPSAGYYVGGLNPALQYVTPFNFNGDIAEWVCYQGSLNESDRLAVINYLQRKYYEDGAIGSLSYQWQFDGTNIAGATNSTLTLNDVQPTNSGTYTVVVSNGIGTTISSNALLAVGSPPSITAQPASQKVVQGTNVSLAVSVAGTGPLSYQWYQNGSALVQDTNSSLSLTNVQPSEGGTFTVTVTSPFGSAVSSNAVLTVEPLPVIMSQPQNEFAVVGGNAVLSVSAAGATLPSVTSGTLELWLKADAGVITNAAGLVSQWQDQSGNGNNALQANVTNQPVLGTAAALGGEPVVQFNGIQDGVHGSYLHGAGSVGLPNAMTSFLFYNPVNTANSITSLWLVGVPGQVYGASRIDSINYQKMVFSGWTYEYDTPFVVPTNTYRIWNDRLASNSSTLEMYDYTTNSSTNFVGTISGLSAPGPGYYVGGLNPALQYVSPFNFNGNIGELIIYQGYLNENDRLAVINYLEQKYYEGGGLGRVSYQWQFDGTNIAGATNSMLTLNDVQLSNSGSYTVVVSNLVGSVTSSNAVLTVGVPPSIITQPASQSVESNCAATFNIIVSGVPPFTYQWTINGQPAVSQTNSTLTINNVQAANVGSYSVVVGNSFGATTSSVAVLALASAPAATSSYVLVQRFAGGGARISVADLITNFTAALYDTLTVTNVGPNTIEGGNVTLNGPWIYYLPPAGSPSIDLDLFDYSVSDGHCGTATGLVLVQTIPDNPQPANFAIGIANGAVQLSFDGIPNTPYQLEFSDDLRNWQILTNGLADNFGLIQWADASVTNTPARFYRALSP